MCNLRQFLVLLLAPAFALGQQLLWQIPATTNSGCTACFAFSDYDRDGYNDILAYHIVGIGTAQRQVSLRLLSGRDGALLHSKPFTVYGLDTIAGAGDFDRDGYAEYHYNENGPIEVYSPRRGSVLFTIPGGTSSVTEPRIDLDGDGLSDVVVGYTHPSQSRVDAFDHQGNLRYTIPARIHGWLVKSVANVGDRDGDGGEDFLVGALGGTMAEGGVFLFSGRTGTMLRCHLGPLAYDGIGTMVGNAGDFDRDGVSDYIAGNADGQPIFRQLAIAWSGATGAVIRVWEHPNFYLGVPITGKHDADLDGVADILLTCPNCIVGPFSYHGAVQVASSRDGLMMQETHPSTAGIGDYGRYVADMGVQPGSPYPVHALIYIDGFQNGGVLQVWRSEPSRSTLSGSDCVPIGNSLIPGLRKTQTTYIGSRVQIAHAPPGALAWCILGDGTATTTGGLPLPVSLDPYGFQGCSLLVPIDFVGGTIIGTNGIDRGYAAFDLRLPLAATGGTRFAVQWLVLDPATGFESWTMRRDFWLR